MQLTLLAYLLIAMTSLSRSNMNPVSYQPASQKKQQPQQLTPLQAAVQQAPQLRLTIKTDKKEYIVGDKIALTATLSNGSKFDFEDFTFPPMLKYHFDILLGGKDKVGYTAYGKWQSSRDVGGIDIYPIAPGANTTFQLNITRLFDLSMSGKYTIKVSRDFAYTNKNKKQEIVTVSSNTVQIEVGEPDDKKKDEKPAK